MGHFAHNSARGGLTIPREIVLDPRLNKTDILFLIGVLEFRNKKTAKMNPGGASLEAITGIAKGNLGRTLTRLVKLGWITYTKGNDIDTNDYKFHIPLECGFKYRGRMSQKMTDEKWKERVKEKKAKIWEGTRKKIRAKETWYLMGEEELISELEHEAKESAHYIPDDVLKNYEILRGGDNSEAARRLRQAKTNGTDDNDKASRQLRHSKTGGIWDMFAERSEPSGKDEQRQYLEDLAEI